MSYESPVTTDLSKFGIREKAKAADLLYAYVDGEEEVLGNGVTVAFNTHSGLVFLTDEDYNVVMLNDDDKLEQFISCPNCDNEGFISQFETNGCESCEDKTYKNEGVKA